MTLRSIAFATAAFSLISVGAASGQVPPPNPMHGACRADIQRLCAGVEHGGGRIMQCMKAHASEVSADCQSAMAARREAKHAARQAPPPPQ
ncbi:MAG TPA: cysteine rich repeat-containing protein [Caulobacteraceae bacterium]